MASGDGFGTRVLGFFFGGASGSIEGEADGVASSFLFFATLASALAGVAAVGVGVGGALFFIAARAEEKGLKRFLKAEPISPKRRAASSASCAAIAAASLGVSGFFSFFDSVLFKTFGLAGTSALGVTLGSSALLEEEGGSMSLSSTSMKGVPLALAAALAL